jgi:hypothetical protein
VEIQGPITSLGFLSFPRQPPSKVFKAFRISGSDAGKVEAEYWVLILIG